MTKTEVWLKQEHDTDKSFEAFCAYRDMENRSTAKVAQSLGKTKALIDRWSSKHHWVDRTGTYDEYLAEKDRKRYLKEKLKAKDERHKIIRAAKGKVVEALNGLDASTVSAAELIRLLALILNEERIEFDDLPTTKTKHSGEVGHVVKGYVNVSPDDWDKSE